MTVVINGTTGITSVNGTAGAPSVTGTDTDTGIVYGTNTLSLATGGTTAVTVDSSQNVGIGTSSPTTKLQVSGGVSFQGSGYPSSGAGLEFQYNAPTGTIGAYDRSGSAYKDFRLFGSTIQFEISGNEKARIDSSGNLLVGTTSTSGVQLATAGGFVSNGIENTWVSRSAGGGSAMNVGRTSGAGTGSLVEWCYNGGVRGSVSTNGTTVAYNTSSDYRLKHDVQPMAGALAKVAALKPVTYKWNADNSDGEGFIAHELAEVVPQCVTGEKDAVDADGNPVYQGIDTSFLVATLTAAIQEQQAIIEQLRADVEALKAAA